LRASVYDAFMTLDDVRRLIAPELPALQARGVTALYVFGSVATGNAGPTSDVDVMVDYDPASGFNLFDLSGVHCRLSERLGVNVDVVTRDGIHRRIRDRVLKEAVRVL
jgi:predicted nucleotidyltransferase